MNDPGDACTCPLCLREERGMSDFDPDWPHGHVCDGKPARIVARDMKGSYPILAVIDCGHTEAVLQFRPDGTRRDDARLVNAPAPPVPLKGWVNVYLHGLFDTRELADGMADGERRACVYLDVKDGEGLE